MSPTSSAPPLAVCRGSPLPVFPGQVVQDYQLQVDSPGKIHELRAALASSCSFVELALQRRRQARASGGAIPEARHPLWYRHGRPLGVGGVRDQHLGVEGVRDR